MPHVPSLRTSALSFLQATQQLSTRRTVLVEHQVRNTACRRQQATTTGIVEIFTLPKVCLLELPAVPSTPEKGDLHM